MTDPAEKYPLWCVDTLTESEDRYIGPFKTEDEAMDVLPTLDGPGAAIRRCRRLKVSELGNASCLDPDEIVGDLNYNPDPGDRHEAWGDWNSEVVRKKISAEIALLEWADAHLETSIYICEGDE